VSITGRAELHDDYDTVYAVGETLHRRYGGEMSHASRKGIEAEATKRIAVFVQPVKTITWDHRKL
jgi:hypothetical protein